jgi:hypothetical protein
MAADHTTPLALAAKAAVAEIDRQYQEGKPGPYVDDELGLESVTIDGHVDMLAVTRAVLTAIREPSEVMKQEGAYQIPGDPGPLDLGAANDTWQAMIDHMLAEGE